MSLSTVLSGLIRDGTTGVVAAERDAAADRLAFEDRLDDPATAFVSREEVDSFLRSRFPPFEEPPVEALSRTLGEKALDWVVDRWTPGETAVRAGALYVHPDRYPVSRFPETPALERTLDVTLPDDVLDTVDGVAVLTPEAVGIVRDAVATRIGERRRDAHRALAAEGYPRPVVDGLDVDVRLAFDDRLDARPVDATDAAVLEPDAIGRVTAKLHFDADR